MLPVNLNTIDLGGLFVGRYGHSKGQRIVSRGTVVSAIRIKGSAHSSTNSCVLRTCIQAFGRSSFSIQATRSWIVQTEQRHLLKAVTDKVINCLLVVTDRQIVRIAVVPLNRQIKVLCFDRLQRRVTTASASIAELKGLAINGHAALNVFVAWASNSFAYRCTQNQVFSKVDIDIQIGQHQIIGAFIVIKGNIGTLYQIEFVTAFPVNIVIGRCSSRRSNICALIAHTCTQANWHAVELSFVVDLYIDSRSLFCGALINVPISRGAVCSATVTYCLSSWQRKCFSQLNKLLKGSHKVLSLTT